MRDCATATLGLQHGWTPVMSLFVLPFAAMPAEQGYLAWTALLLASLFVSAWLLAPGDPPARVVQLALVLVPVGRPTRAPRLRGFPAGWLVSTPHASGARWVLLFECVSVMAQAPLPPPKRSVGQSTCPGTS
jgi:hypothetical protein